MEDKHFKFRVGALTSILAISCAAAYTTHSQSLTGYIIRSYDVPSQSDIVRRGNQTHKRYEVQRKKRTKAYQRRNGMKQLQYTVTNRYVRPAQALVKQVKQEVMEEEPVAFPEIEIQQEQVIIPIVEKEAPAVRSNEVIMSYRESYDFCKNLELSGTRLTHCIGEMQKDGLVYQLTQSGRR